MDGWLGGSFDLFFSFFGRATPTETYVVIALCVFLGAFALSRTGTVLGAIGAFYTTGFFLIIIGLILLISAMDLPSFFGFDTCWVSLLAALVVFFVMVLPLTVLVQKGSYVTALIAWTLALLTVGVILTLEPVVVHQFNTSFEKALRNGRLLEINRIEAEKHK